MLRRAGLALSLGALAAYGLRNAMADHPGGLGGGRRHLDASGSREVVYCHQCDNEWYHDQNGLTCPNCEGEITEIVNPASDPRPQRTSSPDSMPELEELHNHHPWRDSDSDPEEADIEEHVTRGPNGSVFISQTIRSTGRGPFRAHAFPGRRESPGPNQRPNQAPERVIQDFQSMLGNLMGPNLRMGQVGRSGPDAMFAPLGSNPNIRAGGFHMGAANGPQFGGTRFTFTTGRLQPRDADGPQPGPPVDELATYAPPPPNGRSIYLISISARPDQLARILGSLFGAMGPMGPPGQNGEGAEGRRGMPQGLQGLFAQLLNPANAVHGDAVYSQEALDQIISTLMEQHPTSNAPGPAPAASIAALPKKKLDEKMLGPELKGECSVCMDDVHVGDEVVCLPCTHWFHETCATLWLSEHNTCPICRKGLDSDANATPPSASRRSSNSASSPRHERQERVIRRMSLPRRLSRSDRSERDSRNEARLDAIRDRGRLTPTHENQPFTWGSSSRAHGSATPPDEMPGSVDMPASFMGSLRRRESEMSEGRRDTRRANTSGSDQSHRSSQSGNGGSGGPMNWIRDRFSSGRRND